MLTTERLLLRDFLETDWPMAQEYASDVEVVRYMPWDPNTEEEIRTFVQRAISSATVSPRRAYELAIILKDIDVVIGACDIHVQTLAVVRAGSATTSIVTTGDSDTATPPMLPVSLLDFGFDQLNLYGILETER